MKNVEKYIDDIVDFITNHPYLCFGNRVDEYVGCEGCNRLFCDDGNDEKIK